MSEKFKAANAESPIISAGWLGKDMKEVKGRACTWAFHRIELLDSQVFVLSADEMDALNDEGYKPRWKWGDTVFEAG